LMQVTSLAQQNDGGATTHLNCAIGAHGTECRD